MGLALGRETRLAHTQFQSCRMWASGMASTSCHEALAEQVVHWGSGLEKATLLGQIYGPCFCSKKV